MDIVINKIYYFVGTYILTITLLFSWYKLNNKRYVFHNKKNLIILFTLSIITTSLQLLFEKQVRLFISLIILIIFCYKFIIKDLRKSILSVIFFQIIIMISETAVVFFTNIINLDLAKITQRSIGYITVNIIVCIIFYILINNKKIKKIYENANELYEKSHSKEIIIYSIIIIIMAIMSTISSYVKWKTTYVIIINTLLILFFVSIAIKFMNTKKQYENVSSKYQTSINSLKEYEIMIDKFRVNTHENKNELMTIRNMIKNNDKKTIEYIDALVDNKIKDNEKIMYQTSKIPEGGLRATIYSKLCTMDKYKIKYKLDISKDVRTVDLINLDEELILNICKILSVFIDNSIDAVKNLKKKEIGIELYVVDNELYIDITNSFKGEIDLSRIGHERHTTKGKEHGYGLLLVNKIINENKRYLENEKIINGEYFIQTLKIKI